MAYDCAKLMLMGIDKVMKERKATAADLASGKLQQYFTTELFSLTSQRQQLCFCQTTAVQLELRSQWTHRETYRRSTTPPPDGTVYRERLVNSPSSGKGLLILVLGGVGVVFGLVSIVLNFICARQPSFKAASTTFTHIICVGCIMAFVSAAFMAFLAGWTVAQNPKPTFQIDSTSEKWMCKSSASTYPGHIILYAYNVLILLSMLYIARQVQKHERAFSNGAADTAATISVGFVALFLGVVTLPLISGGDPGPATDVARFIVVWILGVLCLGLVVGPKTFAVIISQRDRMSSKLAVQSVAGISTGLRGTSSGAAIDAKLPSAKRTVGHHVRPIPRTHYVDLGRLVYRQYKHGFWTHWKHVQASAMHFSNKNLVVFSGLESSQGFRLGKPSNGAHSHLQLRGSFAVVRSKADITGSTEAYLELEFDSPAAGEDFKQKLDRFFE
ncbi:hypothetical protein DFJ73DRAFT_922833 [Zopfochytrium polystomum]|nr:hypothetical protein DFJ73DRAFT_922833 [Zopfochytrium polystomum]